MLNVFIYFGVYGTLMYNFLHFPSLFIIISSPSVRTKVISFGETKPTRHLGLDLNFVPLESCNPGVGEFIPVPYNHMDICKPESKKSILFRYLAALSPFIGLFWAVGNISDPDPYGSGRAVGIRIHNQLQPKWRNVYKTCK